MMRQSARLKYLFIGARRDITGEAGGQRPAKTPRRGRAPLSEKSVQRVRPRAQRPAQWRLRDHQRIRRRAGNKVRRDDLARGEREWERNQTARNMAACKA